MMVPIMEAIETLNSFGMEVVSGIILGLDTDKPETGQHLLDFIDASQIPLLTINLLQALPQTPLWDRLKRENRLIEDEGRDSNVDFLLPYEDVVSSLARLHGQRLSAGQAAGALSNTRFAKPIRIGFSRRRRRNGRRGAISGSA